MFERLEEIVRSDILCAEDVESGDETPQALVGGVILSSSRVPSTQTQRWLWMRDNICLPAAISLPRFVQAFIAAVSFVESTVALALEFLVDTDREAPDALIALVQLIHSELYLSLLVCRLA